MRGWGRSLVPSLERMFFMCALTVSSEIEPAVAAFNA